MLFCLFISIVYPKKNESHFFVVTKNVGVFSSPKGLVSDHFYLLRRANETEVKKNIYLLDVVFWNEGREVIRHDDILAPVLLKYPEGVEIVDAFVTQATRPKIISPLLQHHESRSTLELGFKVLDHRDGIGFRVIYLANHIARFEKEGVVLGVSKLGSLDDLSTQNFFVVLSEKWWVLLLFSFGFFSLILIVFLNFADRFDFSAGGTVFGGIVIYVCVFLAAGYFAASILSSEKQAINVTPVMGDVASDM